VANYTYIHIKTKRYRIDIDVVYVLSTLWTTETVEYYKLRQGTVAQRVGFNVLCFIYLSG